jgi:hypothetical protein
MNVPLKEHTHLVEALEAAVLCCAEMRPALLIHKASATGNPNVLIGSTIYTHRTLVQASRRQAWTEPFPRPLAHQGPCAGCSLREPPPSTPTRTDSCLRTTGLSQSGLPCRGQKRPPLGSLFAKSVYTLRPVYAAKVRHVNVHCSKVRLNADGCPAKRLKSATAAAARFDYSTAAGLVGQPWNQRVSKGVPLVDKTHCLSTDNDSRCVNWHFCRTPVTKRR